MNSETVSLIVAAFVSGSLGIAAVMRNFKSPLCVRFALFSVLLFTHDALTILEGVYNTGSPCAHAIVTWLLGPSLLAVAGELLFELKGSLSKWSLCYIPLVLATALSFLLEGGGAFRLWFYYLSHFAFFVPALFWIYGMYRGQCRTPLLREHLRYRYALWGGIVCIGLSLSNAWHFAGHSAPPLGTLARIIYLFFIFQTFVQKEFMTAEEVVGKLALFGAISVMLSLIFSLLVSWVGDRQGLFFFNTLIASFVIIVLFDPIRKLSSRFTRKLFLKRNTQIEQELNALLTHLIGVVEANEISRRLGVALKKCLGAGETDLFLLDKDGLSYSCMETGVELPASCALVEYMVLRRGRPFVLETIQTDRDSFYSSQPQKFCETCEEIMRTLKADLVIPFLYGARVVGFCSVNKVQRSLLSNEQLRLFIPASRQIASSLNNAHTYRYLRERDKLAVVGEMAAGLAHEIKNPLGAIKGAAELLRDRRVGEESSEFLNIILDETNRLSSVLTDFLEYAKPRAVYPSPSCDPIKVIEHTANFILQSKVSFVLHAEKKGLTLEADPEVLKQVLVNLFLNALQAMEGSSNPELTVSVKNVGSRRSLLSSASLPIYKIWEGWDPPVAGHSVGYLEIEVKDNGVGILDEDLPRIFAPFFTTKAKGTGLGLAICQRLVEGMGGSIHVRNNIVTGTTFTIHIPKTRVVNEHWGIAKNDSENNTARGQTI